MLDNSTLMWDCHCKSEWEISNWMTRLCFIKVFDVIVISNTQI